MRIIPRVFCIILLFIWVLPIAPAAAWESSGWQYSRSVEVNQDGFNIIELDKSVMDHSQLGFADVRLLDSDGRELGYQVLERGLYSTVSYDARLFDVAVVEGQYNVLSLDMGENGHLHNRVSLTVDYNGDYLRTVEIEASEDNKEWKQLGTDKLFRVGSEYNKSDISYPQSSMRYLRLLIMTQGEKPLTVKSARVYLDSANKDDLSERIPVSISEIKNVSDKKCTDVIVDLGSPSYQVQRMVLDIGDRNFRRSLECMTASSASADESQWTRLSDSQIIAYRWEDYSYIQNEVKIGKVCSRYLKVRLYNQDSPGLDVRGVQVWAFPPRLMADLSPGTYQLWYGNTATRAPQYDLSQFSNLVDKKSLPVALLGQEKVNPDYKAPLEPWTERNKWILNAVVVLAVIVIGAIILKNMRSSGNSPGGDSKNENH